MAQVIIAENIDSPNEDTFKYNIEMIDINTLLFNIMNINTGINYKLYIKKDSEWYKENKYKIQNDFSQLYQIINDCIFDEESLFRYEIIEEKDMIKFLIRMKKDSKFFKVELDFDLERYISDNGIIDDRLNSIEYQLNKLREDVINGKKINELEKKLYDIQLNKNIIEINNIYRVFNECNNLIYKGEMKNGKKEGKGIEYCSQTGQILYDGDFKKGYYDGQGILYNKSSNMCTATNESQYCKGLFEKGLFNGLVRLYIKDKLRQFYLYSETTYENGYAIGEQIVYDEGGTRINSYQHVDKIKKGKYES